MVLVLVLVLVRLCLRLFVFVVVLIGLLLDFLAYVTHQHQKEPGMLLCGCGNAQLGILASNSGLSSSVSTAFSHLPHSQDCHSIVLQSGLPRFAL